MSLSLKTHHMRYRIKDKGLSKTHEKVEAPQSYPTLCNPMDYIACQAPLSMGFSRQEYWSRLPCPPPGDLLNPGFKPRSPTLQVDSLLSMLPGKPKNTGVDSLLLFQGNFLTQELNRGLLHCRWILCQLSYKGQPSKDNPKSKDDCGDSTVVFNV